MNNWIDNVRDSYSDLLLKALELDNSDNLLMNILKSIEDLQHFIDQELLFD